MPGYGGRAGWHALWKNIVVPLAKVLAETLGPAFAALAEIVGGAILDNFNLLFKAVKTVFDIVGVVFDTITKNINGDLDFKATFKAVKDKAFDAVVDVWNGIKDKAAELTAKVASKWSDLKDSWRKIVDNIAGKTADMKAKIASKWNDLEDSWHSITSNIAGKTADMKARIASKWKDFKTKWSGLLANFKGKTVSIGLSISAKVKDLKNWFNTSVIDKVNEQIHKIPLLKSVNIPHLAQGGFVKANTPQLAVIGDNTREGEIVAPESKLRAMADAAARQAQNGDIQQVVTLLQEIVKLLSSLDPDVYLDGVKITKRVIQGINNITSSTKKNPLIV